VITVKVTATITTQYDRHQPYEIEISSDCDPDFVKCTIAGVGDIFIRRSDLLAAARAFSEEVESER